MPVDEVTYESVAKDPRIKTLKKMGTFIRRDGRRGDFFDFFENECAIEEVQQPDGNLLVIEAGTSSMTLSQEQAREILPYFHHFARTGSIPPEDEDVLKFRRFCELTVGDVLNVSVKKLVTYGAFVDLGGIDALLHNSEVSWGRGIKADDVLSCGQEIDVKVTFLDEERVHVGVSLRQLSQNPWHGISGKYPVGSRVKGRVKKVLLYGAFVELEFGVVGLLHRSQMGGGVENPFGFVSFGDEIEVEVVSVNKTEHKIALSAEPRE